MTILELMMLALRDPGPMSSVLTPEEAARQEALGFRVARIPIKRAPERKENP